MSNDTCTFSYVATKDSQPKIATGIECSWMDLKIEFSRQGKGVPGAKYYKTISEQGPELFAVEPDQTVWYHDENKWHRYQTAKDVKYGTIQSENLSPKRGTFSSTTDDDDDEPHFGQKDGTGS
ncbi:unnamed protein product [Rotaria sordida]|uniref:Uncharacterized protein n=1 Tax=Rotaria sordida TaxID=392033 RepID=A0A814HM09_9BILA|nr:unnamed protein product [Rotaria sordida]CAF1059238.1 unnamed protein product [Rotaria sordida]CAF3735043.1 unnamed protein product [Rotaria sordida]CAF3902449.1 unnamed protein product [Rotaria sordida]